MPFIDDHAHGAGRGLHALADKPWYSAVFEAGSM